MDYKKPQSTIVQGNVGIYPLTTADQVILANGSRLEKNGKINVDSAANASKLGGKAPEYYIQPRNLLDNSDFIHPVNQRGITSADVSAWTYFIDRWKVEDNTLTISVETDGIHLTASSGAWFAQWIQMSDNDVGKTFTLAYGLNDGSIITASGTMPDASASEWSEFITGANDTAQIRSACFENRKITVGFNPKSNLVIKWAALYEGSYTADTLPPYVPKGYAAELAECRWTYIPFVVNAFLGYAITDGDGINFQGFIPFSKMRLSNPSVHGTLAAWDGSSAHEIGSVNTLAWQGNGFRLNGALSVATTANKNLAIYSVGSGAFNADL